MTRELVNRWYLLSSRRPSLCKFSSCQVERKNEALLDHPPVEFPLTDSQGIYVEKDRRHLHDRRDPEHHTDDCLKAEAPISGRHTVRAVFFVSLLVAINVAFVLMVYALIASSRD